MQTVRVNTISSIAASRIEVRYRFGMKYLCNSLLLFFPTFMSRILRILRHMSNTSQFSSLSMTFSCSVQSDECFYIPYTVNYYIYFEAFNNTTYSRSLSRRTWSPITEILVTITTGDISAGLQARWCKTPRTITVYLITLVLNFHVRVHRSQFYMALQHSVTTNLFWGVFSLLRHSTGIWAKNSEN